MRFSDKYHKLCPTSKFKRIMDNISNNKPEVILNRGDLSSALISYQWNSTAYTKFGTCGFNVKLDNSYSNASGIFLLINKLKLREHSDEYNNCNDEKCGQCIDYVRFVYKNGTHTRQICGNIETTVNSNLIRNFFDEIYGEMGVEIFIDTSYPMLSERNSSLEVELVFTAYSSKLFFPHILKIYSFMFRAYFW